MLYELKRKNIHLSPNNPKCVFCGKPVYFCDYWCLCRHHGPIYYRVPKFFRVILPLFVLKSIINRRSHL